MQKLLYILNKLITVWYNYSQLSPFLEVPYGSGTASAPSP
jgi:hypothetical protein